MHVHTKQWKEISLGPSQFPEELEKGTRLSTPVREVSPLWQGYRKTGAAASCAGPPYSPYCVA